MSILRSAVLGSVGLLLVACTYDTTTDDPTTPSTPSTSSSSGSPSNPTPTGGCVVDRDIQASETWNATACPDGYLVKNDITVMGAGVELKIEPGTLVKFDSDAGLKIDASAALIAEGTADKKIHFTGYQEAEGTWLGILFQSNNIKNKIAFAKIDSAGAGKDVKRDGAVQLGSKFDQQAARAELFDLEIVNNAHFGLTLDHDAKLAKLERVTIKNNADGVAHVMPTSAAQLKGASAGNVFESNGTDNLVMIDTSILVPIMEDITWSNISPAKYRIIGQNLEGGSSVYIKRHLTIEAGTTIELTGGSGLLVEGGAAGLKAVGSPDKPIVFAGVTESSWKGITFGETTWTENRLEYVTIKNASDAPEFQYYGTGANHGTTAVLMGYNGAMPVKLTMKNVTFSGPNNAAFDLTKKPACVLSLEGTNAGTGAAGAVAVQDL
jgi:hypothetical protein